MGFLRLDHGRTSKGLLIMRKASQFIAQTLLWLTTFAVPASGLPAAPIACNASGACAGRTERISTCPCCTSRNATAFCADHRGRTAGHACCDQSHDALRSTCSCGAECRCGRQDRRPPTAPPVENNRPTEKVAFACTFVATHVDVSSPSAKRGKTSLSFVAALAALDRCARLCRFTV